jgi:PAS domain S-box-containing protein
VHNVIGDFSGKELFLIGLDIRKKNGRKGRHMATERTTRERGKTEAGAAARRRRVTELSARLEGAEATLSSIHGGEGKAVVDSTHAAEAAHTLQGTERAFRVILEDIGEGAVTLTRDGLILFANRRFAEIVRTPIEQVVGSAIFRFVSPSDGDGLRGSLASAMAAPVRAEAALVSQRGGSVPARFSLTASPESEPPAICMVVADLTERLRLEEKLRISEERFRQLFLQNEEPQFLFRGGGECRDPRRQSGGRPAIRLSPGRPAAIRPLPVRSVGGAFEAHPRHLRHRVRHHLKYRTGDPPPEGRRADHRLPPGKVDLCGGRARGLLLLPGHHRSRSNGGGGEGDPGGRPPPGDR